MKIKLIGGGPRDGAVIDVQSLDKWPKLQEKSVAGDAFVWAFLYEC